MQSDMGPLPVRGNDATEILINDHQVIKSLLSDLMQAADMQRRKQTMEQLKAALTIHNATEENLVYPALREIGRKKWESQRLYHETAEADVLLFTLDTMLKKGEDAHFQRTAEMLRDAVHEHIEDEEQSAFPHLQERADPQQSQMLTQSLREFRSMMRVEMPGMAARTETGEISQQAPSAAPGAADRR
jgi:hemerythrin superfamily protein